MADPTRPGSTGPTRRNPSGAGKRGTPVLPTNASTRADLMSQITNDSCAVRDVNSAQTHIYTKWLSSPEDECTPSTLADILFAVSQTVATPPSVTTTIRAIAFCIQAKLDSLIEDKLFDVISAQTNRAMQTFSADLAKSQEFIKATSIAQSEATVKINDALTKCTALETALTTASDKIQQAASIGPALAQEARSWAQVAAAPPAPAANTPQYAFDPSEPPEITRLGQRLLLKTRMVMIEPSEINDNPPSETRDTINDWLKAIDESSEDEIKPKTTVKAVIPQPRGGLLLEFDSAESADRFRCYVLTSNENLLSNIGEGASITDQIYKVILRFVPCNGGFDPTDPICIRAVEESAGLDPFTISSMAWCRPIDKRSPNQSFANVTANITNAKDGNRLLQGRVYIQDKLVTIQKDERQPTLCNKCQQFGHIRRDCANDTRCSACSGPHEIGVCNNRDDPRCASCGPESHHPSNSQQCPHFQRKREDMRRRFPEDSMPFFPVHNDPSTWVRAPTRPVPATPPAQPQYNRPPRPPPPHSRQMRSNNSNNNSNNEPPAYANELWYRQQDLYELNNRSHRRHGENSYRPPQRRTINTNPTPAAPAPAPAPAPPAAAAAPLPSQIREDSADRDIMENDTVTHNRARATAGIGSLLPPPPTFLPPKPPATFEDSLPPNPPQ